MSSNTHPDHDFTTGVLLLVTTLIAMLLANFDTTAENYQHLVRYSTGVTMFHHDIGLRFVVNEVLMCLFFFNIGLELKYNLFNGELSDRKVAAMPFIGAIGGMIMPALIYVLCNQLNDGQLRGWAIPTATDIAFAIGVLSFAKKNVPKSLKAFLLALAIFDDLGAILIIGLFYSHKLNPFGLIISAGVCIALYRMNRQHILKVWPYVLMGLILWFGLFVAGIHTTIGAVITAIAIPMKTTPSGRKTFNERNNIFVLSETLAPFINTIILPIFAFFNAGTSIMSNNPILHPVGIGILAGLIIGKPLGIISFCFAGESLRLCKLPEKTRWKHIIGLGFLCGIGFTMSLFIGKLAFYKHYQQNYLNIAKKSVLTASLLSGLIGLYLLSRLKHSTVAKRKSK